MEVGVGLAYHDWTPMFRFPKSLVIPPSRGQRILKFVVCASKLKSKFDQGKIKNKKVRTKAISILCQTNAIEPKEIASPSIAVNPAIKTKK